jgi:hypothetical protein
MLEVQMAFKMEGKMACSKFFGLKETGSKEVAEAC